MRVIDETNLTESINIVILFGSQARGDSSKNSDVDIAMLFKKTCFNKKNILDLRSELTAVFTTKIKKDCDIIILNQAPLLLKYQILKYGQNIYISPDFDFNSYFSLSLKQYFDFKYYQKIHFKGLLERIKR